MQISILTLFPEMFTGPFDSSIVKRAQDKESVHIEFINIRDFGIGPHKTVDDTPYGGGAGMVMRVDVLSRALDETTKKFPHLTPYTVLLSADGTPFTQQKAKIISKKEHLILLCGHYEGVDERIAKHIDEKISVGDFVVTGGEIPAMLMTDAIVRLLPGVLKQEATDNESFSFTSHTHNAALLEYPQYTFPREYNGMSVPEVLLSGNHQKIADWRQDQAEERTKTLRPDLLKTKD